METTLPFLVSQHSLAQASKEAKDYYNRGIACFKQGETDGAISDFTKAIKKKFKMGRLMKQKLNGQT